MGFRYQLPDFGPGMKSMGVRLRNYLLEGWHEAQVNAISRSTKTIFVEPNA